MSDLVIHGGCIRTLDAREPRPAVLAVRDGRVLAGGEAELAERHPGACRLDLGGRCLIPGLIDAHVHLLGLGRVLEQLDLRGTRSYGAVLELVKDRVAALPPGAFLLGFGWNQESWPEREEPTHARLSLLSPRNPVILSRADGHARLANAAALALANLDDSTQSPPGGEVRRHADGRLTGLFVDAATSLLPKPPPPSEADAERWARTGQRAALRAGLTGAHEMGVDAADFAVLEGLAADGSAALRLNVLPLADFDELHEPAPWLADVLARGPRLGDHDGRLWVTGLKIYLDGALGSRGAALLQPYADAPGATGLPQLDGAGLRRRIEVARAAGFQAVVHAIGDAANRLTLDALAEVLGEHAATDHRCRVEHAQVVDPADVPRFARLGVIASVQPIHCPSDGEMTVRRLGLERARHAHAWRSLVAAGARLALGSDAPVEDERPLAGLQAAITRRAPGLPTDADADTDTDLDQALGVEEALRGFTTDAAFAGFQDDQLGSLTPGRRADFVVLSDDPLGVPPDELLSIQVEETWIGGRRAWPEP